MDAAAGSQSPFAGVRVLEFSQVLAGPYGGRLLAEMGADVIKVEAPGGDLTRVIGPESDRGQSGLYTWANLGKRNVCIDLRRDGGVAVALDLVKHCDIVCENFRPGVADRLGVGWNAVHAANPRAVMLSVCGYGSDSSLGDRGAFAPTMHAYTGLIEYQARKSGQPMVNLSDARADLVTALHAMIGVLAALRVAERTGEGERVELAMFDSVLATFPETPYELLDPPWLRMEPAPFDAGPHGHVVVAGPPAHVWVEMARAFDIADPAPPDADLPTKARLRRQAIEQWMTGRDSREALLAELEARNLPAAAVVSLRDALTGDFAVERELLMDVDDRAGGTRPVVRLPYRFSRSAVGPSRPAPRKGEHNADVLSELLGMSAEQVAALEAAGVLQRED